jgi:hypothetical protein
VRDHRDAKMITSCHGSSFAIDSWTGESFAAEKKFKIPTPTGQWKGCYATPSTALAGIEDYVARVNPSPSLDEHHYLRETFQSSLVKDDPKHEFASFTIKIAPSFTTLAQFGGKLSYQAYHDHYDHDIQRRIFSQVLPKPGIIHETTPPKQDTSSPSASTSVAVATQTTKAKRSTTSPNNWRFRMLVPGVEPPEEDGSVTMPRCFQSWLEFLSDNTVNEDIRHAMVVYIHPREKMFAIGSPSDWATVVNKKATEMWNKIPVFGPVAVFRKNEFKSVHAPPKKKPRTKNNEQPEKAQEKAPSLPKPPPSTPAASTEDDEEEDGEEELF